MASRRATYIGPIEALAGRRASIRIREACIQPGHVLAQFDDDVTVNDAHAYLAMGTSLAWGWHKFREADFDIDVEYE